MSEHAFAGTVDMYRTATDRATVSGIVRHLLELRQVVKTAENSSTVEKQSRSGQIRKSLRITF